MPAFGSAALEAMGDAGIVAVDGTGLALTTDSFVVKPIRFPGGSIGELAVNGTVNDLAVSGARPLALSLSLVLEEGLAADELRAEVEAIAAAARAARGRDRRRRHQGRRARPRRLDVRLHDRASGRSTRARASRPPRCGPGDRVLVSGPVGEHGTAIMLARGELGLDAEIESDTCSLWPAVDALLDAAGPVAALHARRDPRRRRLGAERAGARLGRRDDRARGRRAGRPGGRRAPPSCSASTRCTSPTRASSSPSSRPRRPTRRSPRCARCRAASARPRSAR